MPVLTLLLALTTWVWPLPPPVTVLRPFLPPATAYGPGHRGVDLAGTPGLAVLAAGPGVVSVAGPVAGRGVVVVVHGQLRTTYEPVTAEVRVGQVVASGQRIGTLARGHPGCPRPACLHWGLLRGRTYLDPLTLVGRGPVRLLPLTGTGAAASTATDGVPGAEGRAGGSPPGPSDRERDVVARGSARRGRGLPNAGPVGALAAAVTGVAVTGAVAGGAAAGGALARRRRLRR